MLEGLLLERWSRQESGCLISFQSLQRCLFRKPGNMQITGLNFAKNRVKPHYGLMHCIDCSYLERFAYLARMKTIN